MYVAMKCCHGTADGVYVRLKFEYKPAHRCAFLSMRLCSMNLKLYKLARIIGMHILNGDGLLALQSN